MTFAKPAPVLERLRLAWPLALAFLAALPAASCSSDSDSHPAAIASGGSSASAGHSGQSVGGSGGSNADAGEGNSLGGDAAGGEPGTVDSDAGPGRPPVTNAACSEIAAWSGATKIPNVSTAAEEALLSVTSDELDLAFLRAGALYVVHRADTTSTFTVGAAVAIPAGWSAAQGAALSADGKRLLLVSSDQTLLGEMSRASRGTPFAGVVDQSAFSVVNQTSMYSGNVYASPALSPDDQELFLSSTSPSGPSTIVVSTRSAGQPWTAPTRVISALDGAAGARRLPTGVSADSRTLFYFNEETMKEEARWRDEPKLTSPLYDMVDLGTRRGAQPNAACDRLYSDSTSDVVVEGD